MKGLYIHIPFCIKKCKYCDFNSFTACDSQTEKYLNVLMRETEQYKNCKIDTVFIGGGTPTSLDERQLEMLLNKINAVFDVSCLCEFTVETNPKTVTEGKLKILLNNGVNRLSIGVQSFVDAELSALGRIHTAQDAEETIMLAKETGFQNISIDLMEGIPYQTKESFKKSLDKAFSLEPTHISCYSLILEEGTPLFDEVTGGITKLPSEDTERDIYDFAVEELQKHGYFQYEISNFAREGKTSKHNLKYWNCDEYIGVGLSAHSYLDGVRFSNTDDFDEYILENFAKYNVEKLTDNDKMSEFMFLGLRKTEGISKEEFFKRFNRNVFDVFENPLKKYINSGFITDENGRIYLSEKAISVSNSIMCEFIL